MLEECRVSLNWRLEIVDQISAMVCHFHHHTFDEVALFDQETSCVLSPCIRRLEKERNGCSCCSCDSLQPFLTSMAYAELFVRAIFGGLSLNWRLEIADQSSRIVCKFHSRTYDEIALFGQETSCVLSPCIR